MSESNPQTSNDEHNNRGYKTLEQVADIIAERNATIKQLQEENEILNEALKMCIDDLMYMSTAGHLLMRAQRDRAVPERLLEIRKLVYP